MCLVTLLSCCISDLLGIQSASQETLITHFTISHCGKIKTHTIYIGTKGVYNTKKKKTKKEKKNTICILKYIIPKKNKLEDLVMTYLWYFGDLIFYSYEYFHKNSIIFTVIFIQCHKNSYDESSQAHSCCESYQKDANILQQVNYKSN